MVARHAIARQMDSGIRNTIRNSEEVQMPPISSIFHDSGRKRDIFIEIIIDANRVKSDK